MSRILVVAVLAVLALSVTATQVEVESEAAATERIRLETEAALERALTGVTGFKPPKTPANKLPKTASDSKPAKAKRGQNEKSVMPAAIKNKESTLSKTRGALKSIVKALTKDVSIVTKQVFDSVKKAKRGANIGNLINLVNDWKTKIANWFKKTTGMRLAAAKPACHWIVSVDSNYKTSGWRTTSMSEGGTFGSWLPGTCAVGTKVTRLGSYNCFSGATQKSVAQTASANANANFICVDAKNTVVSPPGNCKAKVQFYAGYKATTYSWSESGWVCPLGSRYIQVSAAHEAQIQVNGQVPVAKGVVTSTGNSITESYSFSLSAGAGGTAKKEGPEASANVGVSFGYTVNEVRDFGEKTNLVAVQHQSQYDVPMTAILSTIASTQINGGGRVGGFALSETDAWMMCLAATSVDCGMPNTGALYGVGEARQFQAYQSACSSMMRNNNVRF